MNGQSIDTNADRDLDLYSLATGTLVRVHMLSTLVGFAGWAGGEKSGRRWRAETRETRGAPLLHILDDESTTAQSGGNRSKRANQLYLRACRSQRPRIEKGLGPTVTPRHPHHLNGGVKCNAFIKM